LSTRKSIGRFLISSIFFWISSSSSLEDFLAVSMPSFLAMSGTDMREKSPPTKSFRSFKSFLASLIFSLYVFMGAATLVLAIRSPMVLICSMSSLIFSCVLDSF